MLVDPMEFISPVHDRVVLDSCTELNSSRFQKKSTLANGARPFDLVQQLLHQLKP